MLNSYFDTDPCITVGMREIKIVTYDRDDFGSRPPKQEIDRLQIDTRFNTQRLTINWMTPEDGSLIEEISYLAIGPVSPPPPGPQ
jgi:hypothetical protein